MKSTIENYSGKQTCTINLIISLIIVFLLTSLACNKNQATDQIEIWDRFEVQLQGPNTGNPFQEVQITASFSTDGTRKDITGFYDGDGIYKIRFMPDKIGTWSYVTKSNRPELNGKQGTFLCIPASGKNHGPVQVFNTYHFRYADGTPYQQIGTTCYAWVHQGDSLENKTLETLKNAPFNKLRMCIFPKDYTYNKNEPRYYPFKRDSLGNNDFTRFDPAFWQHLERRLEDLLTLGIQADIILFHPYDRWGYAVMPDSVDEFYLEYVLARLSAWRHVWWSAANEFDFMHNKSMPDWHRFFEILYRNDPYHRLRSIHNGLIFYDHTLPWITHASIQSTHFDSALAWRERYQKPLIYDECRYEGDVTEGWGNLTPQEMNAMFWKSLINGAYAGHGETYKHPQDILWWSKGGELHGQSPARIAFFKSIQEQTPATGLEPIDPFAAGKFGEQYIYYFGEQSPVKWSFDLPPNIGYQVEVIDTWDMKCDTLHDKYSGKFTIDLPAKKYIAVRITKSDLIFPIKDPDYFPKGSLFYDQIVVRLTHPYPNTLRYTLDGSVPSINSQPYTGSILINKNTPLRVLSIEGNRMSNLLAIDFKQSGMQPATEVDGLDNGLEYRLFKGKWESMPDFTKLTPLKKGLTNQIDPGLVDENEDFFGLVFQGYILIPEDQVYNFYASSDDGSLIFIDGQKVVDNDGVHGVVEQRGQIGLKQGYHALEVRFFDNWYGQFLKIEIESPKMARQAVPSTMLFHTKRNIQQK
ncbi:MAG TPA: DUF5605 domain-containing protein [bacterium]|nr:DUF5605 domain-containing protein [bacterium]HPN45565.1 DUF5605 domain-containing protein [bacterium]